jgi:hypothetical protein
MPANFAPRLFVTHPDPHVRRYAIKVQLKLEKGRSDMLHTALTDTDIEVIRLGLNAIQGEIPRELAPIVERMASDRTADQDIRVLAIRTLGRSTSPSALAILMALVDGGKTFFGRSRLAPKSPEMLAALRVLAFDKPAAPGVFGLVNRAENSADPDIRDAVTRPRAR